MIRVNGESVNGLAGLTVSEFLKKQGYDDRMIAVEINEKIIPRAAWDETMLKDESVVEVIRFVGGG